MPFALFNRPTPKKASETESHVRGDKINTINPVANEALNRDMKSLQSKELQEIESTILAHANKVQAKAGELSKAIEDSKERKINLQIEKGRAKGESNLDKYISLKSELEKENSNAENLIRQRDELLNTEIPSDEYKSIIESAVSVFERESSERVSEITTLLAEASSLIESQYDEAAALNRCLAILTKTLSSSQHQQIIDSTPIKYREMFGGIAVKNTCNLLRYKQWISSCIDHLNREYNN